EPAVHPVARRRGRAARARRVERLSETRRGRRTVVALRVRARRARRGESLHRAVVRARLRNHRGPRDRQRRGLPRRLSRAALRSPWRVTRRAPRAGSPDLAPLPAPRARARRRDPGRRPSDSGRAGGIPVSDFEISTDPARLDLDAIHSYLARSYWAK